MTLPLRKADYLLFIFFIALAGLIAAGPLLRASASGKTAAGSGEKVKIISQGDIRGIYSLEEDRDIEIEANGHRNIVSIRDCRVHMDYSDCKNQICVNTGEITEPGEIIVCLPNYVIVEIIKDSEGGDGDAPIDAVVK